MRINEKHNHREYRGMSYLPCVVAQVIDGNQEASHSMYLLVAYIELPAYLMPRLAAAS